MRRFGRKCSGDTFNKRSIDSIYIFSFPDQKDEMTLVRFYFQVEVFGIFIHDPRWKCNFVPFIPIVCCILRKDSRNKVWMFGGNPDIGVFWKSRDFPRSIFLCHDTGNIGKIGCTQCHSFHSTAEKGSKRTTKTSILICVFTGRRFGF